MCLTTYNQLSPTAQRCDRSTCYRCRYREKPGSSPQSLSPLAAPPNRPSLRPMTRLSQDILYLTRNEAQSLAESITSSSLHHTTRYHTIPRFADPSFRSRPLNAFQALIPVTHIIISPDLCLSDCATNPQLIEIAYQALPCSYPMSLLQP